MSKSAILSSSIAKKYWMALTGLFLCLFLIGHLIGNLQLILKNEEEGKLAFNQYAYFMAHNPMIKILSYLTYLSILFHAVDGILLALQNKKARPISYTYSNPSSNTSFMARKMAVLGTVILLFIVIHMANFWYKVKVSNAPVPLHKVMITDPQSKQEQGLYVTHTDNFVPVSAFTDSPMAPAQMIIKNGTEFYNKQVNVKMGEGYKDLHSLVYGFFGHDKTKFGIPKNNLAGIAVLFYVLSMLVLSLHLQHGFSAAFQSLGLNHKRYNSLIHSIGTIFSIAVPLAFAIIPIYIYLTK